MLKRISLEEFNTFFKLKVNKLEYNNNAGDSVVMLTVILSGHVKLQPFFDDLSEFWGAF